MSRLCEEDKRAGIVEPEKGQQARQVSFSVDDLVVEDTTIKGVSIASDTPVMRTFGEERLEISKSATKFRGSTIPLLLNHDPNSRMLGSISNFQIADGIVRADISFDKNYDEAMEIFNSITKNKQRQDLSIGYLPNKYEVKRVGETLAESHIITDFTIFDVSVVGRGADHTSGFYRAAAELGSINKDEPKSEMTKETPKTDDKIKTDAPEVQASDAPATRSAATPDVAAIKETERKRERAAIADLFTLASNHNVSNDTVQQWISNGTTLSQAKDEVLEAVQKRSASQTPPRFTDAAPREDEKPYKDGNVELSMRGAIAALVANQLGERNLSPEASLALDVSKQLGGGNGLKLRVPYDALSTRTFQAGANKQGANIIQDVVRMDMFSKFLYENTVSGKLGLRRLSGLTDDVSIPRQTKTIAANYVAEGGAGTAADMETSSVKLTPHTAIALTKVTNLAKAQIPGIQSMLQDDLLTQLKIAVDRTTLIGGGTNEPTGIMATTGVNTARTGNSNSATRKFNLDEIVTVLGKIQDANVIGTPKIVAPPSLINYWRKQKDSDGQYLWSANTDMTTVMSVPGFLFGLPVYSSTNLRLSGDAATDFRLLIGVFDYAVQAFWGNSFNLEIGTTGSDFSADTASIRAVVYHDAAVVRSAAFESYTKIEV